tara:strand:+ start:1210 stop:2085 length:876 start_codon:yes stop_codon:yes gene_type:complete
MCLSRKSKAIYSSSIRKGGGKERVNDYSILRCEDCNFVYLSPIPKQSNDFYESHEYRKKWDYEYTPDSIHAKYDHEQNERIIRIGIENIRGKSVLDLGASAGVFLDAISSSAATTIAIEPALIYKEYLQSQGHTYYSYPEDACRANEKVDIVTSFDVIEHVEKPKEFLSYAYELLKPGGKLVLSMPNLNDIIKKVEKDKFEQFFYQTAHLNYFSKEAIPELFCDTVFSSIKIDFLHKYSIENMIRWAKYGSPGNVEEVDGVFDRIFDAHYKSEIERLGIASHLFITAERPL